MASIVASEINSLDDLNYQGKLRYFLLALAGAVLFIYAFLNYYPINDKLKAIARPYLQKANCNADWEKVRIDFLLPKLVVSDLTIPASCFGKSGDALKLSYININFHLINLSPFGAPFRVDTELAGQPVSLHLVFGLGQKMFRLKDQTINISKLQPILGDFKLDGDVTVDASVLMSGQSIQSLSFKAASKNLEIPSQTIQGFNLQSVRLNEFYAEANGANPPRITVDKLVIGDRNSHIRANFKGKINLVQERIAMSSLDLKGEVAFSEGFKQSLPLVDMMFQSFAQKDGFYQVRLGGTLGAVKPLAP